MSKVNFDSLRNLHECLFVLPPDISQVVTRRALWVNYRLGEGRLLDKRPPGDPTMWKFKSLANKNK